MPNPVVHFEIQSNQSEKLQKFYADTFGWHVNADNDMKYGLVDSHTDTGIGGGIGPTNGGPNKVTFYIEVDDINAYLGKIEGDGGKTLMPRTEMPMVTMALFDDPEGNTVGLVEAGSGASM